MCGIVGYIGHRQARPILIEGLKRLEYRGYDSAGLALLHDHRITVRRAVAQTIRAALVKNADEPGRAPYQVFLHAGAGGYTAFVMSTVPANKRVVITNVSLTAFLEPGTSVGYVRLQAYDPTTLHLLSEIGVPFNQNPYPTSPIDGTRRYVVN